MALQYHKAFCKNFLIFSSYFAALWVIVNEFWSKAINFQIFQKHFFFQKHKFWSISWTVAHAFWSKIIKLGKFLIFVGGSNRPFLVIVYSPSFLTKNHQICTYYSQNYVWSFLIVINHEFWLLSSAFDYKFYRRK